MTNTARRWLRILVASVVLLPIVLVLALQLPFIATWAVRKLATAAPLNTGYRLDIGRARGNWLTDLRLRDVRLLHEGRVLADIDDLRIGYNLPQLVGPETQIRLLTIDGGRVTAQREGGSWDIAEAFGGGSDTSAGGGSVVIRHLDVQELQLVAQLAPDSVVRIRDLTIDAEDVVLGEQARLELNLLHATIIPPGEPVLPLEVTAAGAVTPNVIRLDTLRVQSFRTTVAGQLVLPRSFHDARVADKLEASLEATPLALADVARFVPGIVPEGELHLELDVSSQGKSAAGPVTAQLGSARLRLEGSTLLGSGEPARYRVSGEMHAVDPSELVRAAPKGLLTGEIQADLRGERLRSAEGSASVRLTGSRLAGTSIESLHLTADVNDGRAELDLRSHVADARLNVDGWVRPFDSIPSYRLAGVVRGIPGADALARALSGEWGAPELNAGFRVAGRGMTLETASLTGRISLAAQRRRKEPTPLGHASVRLRDGRLRARPELRVAGGRIAGVLIATVGDTVAYKVRQGVIDHVDLGLLLEDSLAAPVSGEFSVEGRGLSPEQAVARARVQLDAVRYGERRLDDVVAQVRLRHGRTMLDLDADLEGGTLAVDATALPFASPIRFTVDSATLERVDLGSFLDRPDLSGPVSLQATASGRLASGMRVIRGRVTIAPSRLGGIEVAGGTVRGELNRGLLTYDVSVRTTGGSLALAGQARPMQKVPSIQVRRGRVDSLDLGTLLGLSDMATSLNARFTASAVGLEPDQMRARIDLDLLDSRINQAQVAEGNVELGLTHGELDGEIRLAGADVEVNANVSGELTGQVQQVGASGSVRVEQLARWTLDSVRNGRLEGKFTVDAAIDSAGLLGMSGTVTAAGGLGSVRIHSLHASLERGTGVIVVDTFMLRSNVAAVDGAGRLSLRDTGQVDTLRLRGRTGDLNPLAAFAGIDSLSLDSSQFTIAISGPPERRRITTDASAHRLLYGGTLVEQIEGNAAAVVDSTGVGGLTGKVQLSGLATGAVTIHKAQVAGRYDSLLALQGSADFGYGVSLAVNVRGEVQGDTSNIRLQQVQLVEDGRTWNLARPSRLALWGDGLEVNDFTLRTAGRHIKLDGVLALSDTSDVTLRIDSLELGTLHKAGLVPVPGRLSATLGLTGPARAPVLDGKVALTLHDGETEDLGRIESALEWTRRGLQIDAVAAHQRGGELSVAGTLPWGFTLAPGDTTRTLAVVREPGDTLHLAVKADSFQIALLRPFTPPQTTERLRGELTAQALVRGTPEMAQAEGGLRLTGLGFEIPALDVSYGRGRLEGVLNGDVFRIDTLLLHTAGNGELAAEGVVRLRPLTNPELDVTARLKEFLISSSAKLLANGSGRIHLGGTLETPVVTGTLSMGRTEFYASGAGLAVEDVELTPEDRLEVARHFGPAVLADAGSGDGFLDRFRLDLDLRLPEQVWFRRAEAPALDVEVSGRIRIVQEPGGEMRLFGTVEPVARSSTLDVYGRTFELTGGEILLRGSAEETLIDVTAEYQVPTQGQPDNEGVIINVAATGRPDSISLEFSSEPDMEQEDMISYIVTGRPSSDNPLVQRSGDGPGGGDLALSQLTEAVSGAVGQELGFDVFQIRQDGTRGLMLTAGRYLTPHFYVSLQQPLELSGQDDLAPGSRLGPGFELQYRMQPSLWLTLQGGSLPTGVRLRGRHAY